MRHRQIWLIKSHEDFRFQKAYETYLARKWSEAEDLLNELLKEFPGDAVCELYLERCRRNIASEPDDDWDGTTRLDSK